MTTPADDNARLNCWEFTKCGREPGGDRVEELGVCPAATWDGRTTLNRGVRGGRVCWALAGTLCGGQVQGTFAGKIDTCLKCDYYRYVVRQEGDAVRHALPNTEWVIADDASNAEPEGQVPWHICRAARFTLYRAMVFCRNYTAGCDAETQLIHEMMAALCVVPKILNEWDPSGDDLEKLRAAFGGFAHARWNRRGNAVRAPDLLAVFEKELQAGEATAKSANP